MLTVQLVRVGSVAPETMSAIGSGVERGLDCRVTADPVLLDPEPAFDAARGQYYSTPLLQQLEAARSQEAHRVLGVTELDLFIPILTYVFGEALLSRPPAIISLKRLHPQFYGLPEDPALVVQRARTEALHELGHTFGLIHCPDYACVMHVSRVADEIDLKGSAFCRDCTAGLAEALPT